MFSISVHSTRSRVRSWLKRLETLVVIPMCFLAQATRLNVVVVKAMIINHASRVIIATGSTSSNDSLK